MSSRAGREIEFASDGERVRGYLALPARGSGPGVLVSQNGGASWITSATSATASRAPASWLWRPTSTAARSRPTPIPRAA